MPRFSRTVRVPYSKEQAFALVSDIAAYPSFIKWITAMRVSDYEVREDGVVSSVGDAAVGFKGFVERFSTRVVADPAAGSVHASLLKGPFRRLEAMWQISELERGCDVSLSIDYEFRNFVIGMLAAANHDVAVERILDAFLTEARRRYSLDASPLSGEPSD